MNRARVGFVLREPTNVTFSVVDSEGAEVRRLVDSRRLPGDEELFFAWDGRDDEGRVVPDGVYRLRVEREGKGRAVTSGRRVRVDTKPAQLAIVSARPGLVLAGGDATPVRVRFRGLRTADAQLTVLRTDSGRPRASGAVRRGWPSHRPLGREGAGPSRAGGRVRVQRECPGPGGQRRPLPPAPRAAGHRGGGAWAHARARLLA